MKRLLPLILIVLFAISAIPNVDAQPEGTVKIYIFGPTVAATGSVSEFNISVVGGPGEEDGNYSIKAHLEGTNLTGALPLRSSPHQDTNPNGTFAMNVTVPTVPQTITLVINATSSKDENRAYSETEYTIQVVEPVTIGTIIVNTGSLKLTDVAVKFYVDGEFIGNQTIESLDAGNSTDVSIEWLVADIGPGRHEIRITVDMNNDGIINESDGDLVIIQYFYKEYEGIHPAIIVVLSIIMILTILILIRTIRKKRRGW